MMLSQNLNTLAKVHPLVSSSIIPPTRPTFEQRHTASRKVDIGIKEEMTKHMCWSVHSVCVCGGHITAAFQEIVWTGTITIYLRCILLFILCIQRSPSCLMNIIINRTRISWIFYSHSPQRKNLTPPLETIFKAKRYVSPLLTPNREQNGSLSTFFCMLRTPRIHWMYISVSAFASPSHGDWYVP